MDYISYEVLYGLLTSTSTFYSDFILQSSRRLSLSLFCRKIDFQYTITLKKVQNFKKVDWVWLVYSFLDVYGDVLRDGDSNYSFELVRTILKYMSKSLICRINSLDLLTLPYGSSLSFSSETP